MMFILHPSISMMTMPMICLFDDVHNIFFPHTIQSTFPIYSVQSNWQSNTSQRFPPARIFRFLFAFSIFSCVRFFFFHSSIDTNKTLVRAIDLPAHPPTLLMKMSSFRVSWWWSWWRIISQLRKVNYDVKVGFFLSSHSSPFRIGHVGQLVVWRWAVIAR